nr:reverse transcriptase domain-containing protein [Tanacetum cinerariifolium]
MPNLKPSIPYPSRRDDERRPADANEQIEKFYEIFKDMSFEISFTDALILMPKFASTLKALIGNKEKLSEMARTPMHEHCSAVILNKLPKKLRDPGKFLIPCEFPGMDECLALADLDRSVSKPIGIAKDVKVKVGGVSFCLELGVRVTFRLSDLGYRLVIEDQFQEDPREVPMADNRTMAQLLQVPTVGYEDAVVIPEIVATNFELKHAISSDVAELKDMVRALLLDKKNQSSSQATSPTPAPIKAIESNCVTCGGTHSYQNCPTTSGNVYQDNINEYVSQAATANYNQGNTGF